MAALISTYRRGHSNLFERHGARFKAGLRERDVDNKTGHEAVNHGWLGIHLHAGRDWQTGQDAHQEAYGPRAITRPIDALARTRPGFAGEQVIRRDGSADRAETCADNSEKSDEIGGDTSYGQNDSDGAGRHHGRDPRDSGNHGREAV